MPRLSNLAGQKFGRWVVVEHVPGGKHCAQWKCRCECGTERVVLSNSLVSGRSTSCGCYGDEVRKAVATKHGHNTNEHGQSATYKTWRAMLRRCSDKDHHAYRLYGGRGVKVAPDWLSFENFLRDMGERPEGKTLDRVNSDGDYCKENCRWLTPQEQANNMRTNRWLDFNGKKQTVANWARELGISANTIRGRLFRGYSVENALRT